MDAIFSGIKKYGVTGVLVMWLWYTDNRLSKVEQQLWDCYKSASITSATENKPFLASNWYAILPKQSKVIYRKHIILI